MRTLGIIGASLAGGLGGLFVGVLLMLLIPGAQSFLVVPFAIFSAVWLGMVVAKATRKGAV